MKTLHRHYSEDKTKKNFSNVIWIYDIWSKLTEAKALRKVIDLAEINKNEKILEVAVGTGNLFEKIIKINTNGINEGIDISPTMLNRAKKRLNKYKNVNLKEGSAYKLPYEDNYFDLIVNNYMFDLLPEEDFELIINEFYRVLKPEGRIIISSMSFGEKWHNRIWYYISRFLPRLMTNCRPIYIRNHIENTKFEVVNHIKISQNTFPTEIVKAIK